jgi:type II secretory pathway pseudopilin PulG
MRPASRPGLAAAAGYSLIELIVAMGIFTVIMGVTLTGLANVIQGNEVVMSVAQINNTARAGMDLMVRDMLQVGSGLPASHAVSIPNGGGSQRVRLPGPPGTNFQTDATDVVLPAIIPRAGAGPVIDGVATDVVTMLMADNAFLDVALSAVAASQVTVAAGPDIENGPDRVTVGQLMLISKGSFNTLVQVTDVNYNTRVLRFQDNDSLRLNQSGAANGNLPALNAQAPVNSAASTRISRLRMITYYMDNTDVNHPRLVRRVNNGSASTFDNTLGTAVAIDSFDLQFTYDISNGVNNPGGVEMTASDLGTGGACAPDACGETQIRKVNIRLQSRATTRNQRFLNNVLESQVSLRAMAFVDRYR